MGAFKRLWDKIKPVDVEKNTALIADYWEKDRLRKIEDAKHTRYSQDELKRHTSNVKKELANLGATDICLIAEGITAPQLQFKIKDIVHTTAPLYDMGYPNVISEINKILKK